MVKLSKWTALIFSWLTLSPLIVYLGRRWKMGNIYLWIIGVLISPLFLILYILLFYSFVKLAENNDRRHYFQNRDRIEKITEVNIPKFKVIEYYEGQRGFNGDFNDWFTIEFRADPPDELFDKIDKLIETGETSWHKEGNDYIFNRIWGNGIPAPPRENDNDDRFFSITITRGEKQGIIRHGIC